MIKITALTKEFRRQAVFENLSLTLLSKRTVILGPNGSGKTTLFRCMVGYYRNYKGSILINDRDENHIGYLPQFFSIFPTLTVREALELFLTMQYPHFVDRATNIQHCLELTNLSSFSNTLVKYLSGGMKQRLGIAQAFLGAPDLIILDEPFVGLDPEERLRIIEGIRNYDGGANIVLSTHIANDVQQLTADVVLLDQGSVLFQGSEQDFVAPLHNRIYYLNDSQHLPANAFVVRRELDRNKVFMPSGDRDITGEYTLANPTVEDAYIVRIREAHPNDQSPCRLTNPS